MVEEEMPAPPVGDNRADIKAKCIALIASITDYPTDNDEAYEPEELSQLLEERPMKDGDLKTALKWYRLPVEERLAQLDPDLRLSSLAVPLIQLCALKPRAPCHSGKRAMKASLINMSNHIHGLMERAEMVLITSSAARRDANTLKELHDLCDVFTTGPFAADRFFYLPIDIQQSFYEIIQNCGRLVEQGILMSYVNEDWESCDETIREFIWSDVSLEELLSNVLPEISAVLNIVVLEDQPVGAGADQATQALIRRLEARIAVLEQEQGANRDQNRGGALHRDGGNNRNNNGWTRRQAQAPAMLDDQHIEEVTVSGYKYWNHQIDNISLRQAIGHLDSDLIKGINPRAFRVLAREIQDCLDDSTRDVDEELLSVITSRTRASYSGTQSERRQYVAMLATLVCNELSAEESLKLDSYLVKNLSLPGTLNAVKMTDLIDTLKTATCNSPYEDHLVQKVCGMDLDEYEKIALEMRKSYRNIADASDYKGIRIPDRLGKALDKELYPTQALGLAALAYRCFASGPEGQNQWRLNASVFEQEISLKESGKLLRFADEAKDKVNYASRILANQGDQFQMRPFMQRVMFHIFANCGSGSPNTYWTGVPGVDELWILAENISKVAERSAGSKKKSDSGDGDKEEKKSPWKGKWENKGASPWENWENKKSQWSNNQQSASSGTQQQQFVPPQYPLGHLPMMNPLMNRLQQQPAPMMPHNNAFIPPTQLAIPAQGNMAYVQQERKYQRHAARASPYGKGAPRGGPKPDGTKEFFQGIDNAMEKLRQEGIIPANARKLPVAKDGSRVCTVSIAGLPCRHGDQCDRVNTHNPNFVAQYREDLRSGRLQVTDFLGR